MAIKGLSKAAATCMSPESLVITNCTRDNKSTASGNVVFPHKLTQPSPANACIFAPSGASLGEPNSQTFHPSDILRLAQVT